VIKGIDHVAIAVENLDDTLEILERVFGVSADHREEIAAYNVEVATLTLGNTAIELVQGTTPDSPIAKYIARRGPGIHHIALNVDDIESAIATVGKDARMIDQKARTGKDNSRVAFIHPSSTAGILFELVQNRKAD
jgi:methylmalonyl-CoA/ethylmalonyl-CoA epimerase